MQHPQEISLTLDADADLDALEHVRRTQGLSSLDLAAEWLLKTSLRRAANRASGGPRKLRLVVSQEGKAS